MADSLTNSELLVMSTVLHLNNHTYGVPIVHELERNRRRLLQDRVETAASEPRLVADRYHD